MTERGKDLPLLSEVAACLPTLCTKAQDFQRHLLFKVPVCTLREAHPRPATATPLAQHTIAAEQLTLAHRLHIGRRRRSDNPAQERVKRISVLNGQQPANFFGN